MEFTLHQLSDLTAAGADEIIDVRSPSEYAEDHLPGAINLPVLNDEERARVGTLYKQQSAFLARKVGAALVARNVAAHVETHFMEKPAAYRPLVYCWRGGMRSNAFALILSKIGWRPKVITGGYKRYRRLVVDALYESAGPEGAWFGDLVLIDGNTGTAKTALLHRLAAKGAQVLDLEGLSAHRGSVFGALDRPQPAQKAFDSALASVLLSFDPARPIFTEAESSKIGRLSIPKLLWQKMVKSPRIRIMSPVESRTRYLVRVYPELAADIDRQLRTISRLKPYQSRERIALWEEYARAGKVLELVRDLIEHQYDPAYDRHRRRSSAPELGMIRLGTLDDEAIEGAASRIVELVGDVGLLPSER